MVSKYDNNLFHHCNDCCSPFLSFLFASDLIIVQHVRL